MHRCFDIRYATDSKILFKIVVSEYLIHLDISPTVEVLYETIRQMGLHPQTID